MVSSIERSQTFEFQLNRTTIYSCEIKYYLGLRVFVVNEAQGVWSMWFVSTLNVLQPIIDVLDVV